MKRFIQILLISLSTLILVANNVVLQYVEKYSIVTFEDQDGEEGKTDKNNSEEKAKEYFNSIFTTTIQNSPVNLSANYLTTNNNQLPSISIDVELLPPNFS
jgi:hypothetical protein